MQKGLRLKGNLRQKSVLRISLVTAGFALMAGIGFFVVANFGSSTNSMAERLSLPGISSSVTDPSVSTISNTAPVRNFEVTPKGHLVHISWTTNTELVLKQFTVERSMGDGNFALLSVINASAAAGEMKNYTLTDDGPKEGKITYRLSYITQDGTTHEVTPASIQWKAPETSLEINGISPNPFRSNFLVQINCEKPQKMGIYMYDIKGNRVAEHRTDTHVGNTMINMTPGDDLAPGVYMLTVVGEDMVPHTTRLQKL